MTSMLILILSHVSHAVGFDTKVNQGAEITVYTRLSTFSTVERTPTPSPLSPPSDDNDGGEGHHDDPKRMDEAGKATAGSSFTITTTTFFLCF